MILLPLNIADPFKLSRFPFETTRGIKGGGEGRTRGWGRVAKGETGGFNANAKNHFIHYLLYTYGLK